MLFLRKRNLVTYFLAYNFFHLPNFIVSGIIIIIIIIIIIFITTIKGSVPV